MYHLVTWIFFNVCFFLINCCGSGLIWSAGKRLLGFVSNSWKGCFLKDGSFFERVTCEVVEMKKDPVGSRHCGARWRRVKGTEVSNDMVVGEDFGD